VLLATDNTPVSYLRACIDSVIKQIYPHWELCIADDASTKPKVRQALEIFYKKSPTKIKVTYCNTKKHISATTNEALALAKGEFVALLEPEDFFTKDALFEVVKHLNKKRNESVDLIYSDEDGWDELQQRFVKPFFKPNWAPEMLKGQMYIGHLCVYRKTLVDGFRLGTEGSQDWDLALRVTEKTDAIQHIPKILYHRRKYSLSRDAHKNHAIKTGLKVVQEALDREGEDGRAVLNKNNRVLVHYPVKNNPLVSIIIPTKDKADLLSPCLDSIINKTNYPNWEIIIVDNGSEESKTFQIFDYYIKKIGSQGFKVHPEPSPFNFSYLVNQGVKAAQGSIILLLNNDTELISPSWLEEMIGYAQRQAIGCVGAKLLYPNNTIQHAGIICGIKCIARHGHLNFPLQSSGYFDRLSFVVNYSAVTGACLMIKRSLWEKVDGFDEQLVVGANDVDFCLRLLKQGYRHVVLPQVLLYHHESKSRGEMNSPSQKLRVALEIEFMQKRWPKIWMPDPYYSPHLNQKNAGAGDFSMNPDSIYAVVTDSISNEDDNPIIFNKLKKFAVSLLSRKAVNKLRVFYYWARLLISQLKRKQRS